VCADVAADGRQLCYGGRQLAHAQLAYFQTDEMRRGEFGVKKFTEQVTTFSIVFVLFMY
jgi:hypothetical protein